MSESLLFPLAYFGIALFCLPRFVRAVLRQMAEEFGTPLDTMDRFFASFFALGGSLMWPLVLVLVLMVNWFRE